MAYLGALSAVAGVLLASFSVPLHAAAETCKNGFCNWRAIGVSGYSNSVNGTGASTTVWSQYSVDRQASGFSDQAVWLGNWNGSYNFGQSLEAGIYSGAGVTIPWTNAVLPYDTYSDGHGEHDVNQPQALGQPVWMAVGICGGCGGSIMQIGSYVEAIQGGTYQIATPIFNYTQGEVSGLVPNEYGDTNPTSWMCGA